MRFTSYVLILGALFIAKSSMSQIKVTPAITHVSCSGSTNGSIKLAPTGTGTPYTYAWQPGSTTGNNISIKGIGAYSVTVTNASATSTVNVYNIGYKIKWQSFYPGMSTSANGDTLIHANDGSNTWLKTADGANVLPGSTDGWVEYVVTNTTYAKMFGFLDAGSGTAWNNVDFAMMLNAGGSLNSVANGTQYSIGSYTAGDVLRIERSGSAILYKKNGATISTTVIATPMVQSTLTIRAAINSSSGRFENMGCSFSIAATAPNVSAGANKIITITSPTVVLSGSSSTSGATFLWSPGGSTIATPTVSSPGIYTLSVATASCINTATTSVVYKLSCIPTMVDYQNDQTKGQTNIAIAGGIPPYNIAWNGGKLPSAQIVYNQFKASAASIVIDSTLFKNQIDTLKQAKKKLDLDPGIYTLDVYDKANDSLKVVYVQGTPLTYAYNIGVTIAACTVTNSVYNGTNYVFGQGTCITQSGTYVAAKHFAILSNAFDLKTENYFRFSVPKTTDIASVGLQVKKPDINGGTADMTTKAMFSFMGNSVYYVYFNSSIIYAGVYAANDAFSMKVNVASGKLRFYKNETVVAEGVCSLIDSPNNFWPKVVVGKDVTIKDIKYVMAPERRFSGVSGQISDASCDNICSGSIKASGWFLMAFTPSYYEIYDQANTLLSTIQAAGASSVVFENLCPGTYNVKFYGSITGPYEAGTTPVVSNVVTSQIFEVAYKPSWTQLANVQVNPTDFSLTKTNTGIQYTEDAGASSCNTLGTATNGWIEWLPPTAFTNHVIGLSDIDAGLTSATIDYGIMMWRFMFFSELKLYLMVKNGTIMSQSSGLLYGVFINSDKFRLENSGSTLSLKVNNSVKGQFTGFSTTQTYVADASMYIINGDINHPRLSFGCPAPIVYGIPKEELDGTYYRTSGKKLYLKYDEKYINENLKFNVYDMAHTTLNTSALVIPKKYGNNWLLLDFSSVSTMTPNKYYILEVFNEKGMKEYVRFLMN